MFKRLSDKIMAGWQEGDRIRFRIELFGHAILSGEFEIVEVA